MPELQIPMHLIFETEDWIVVASDNGYRPITFEVVHKLPDHPTQAFLHGPSVDYLFGCIKSWQQVTPHQDQVEATLSWLEWINITPLVVH